LNSGERLPNHNGVIGANPKTVRQSVPLPAKLIESEIEAEQQKQREFFHLAERFRNEANPKAASRLGEKLGWMVFGN